MEIRPDEIGNILRDRIKGLETGEAELSEVGTVLQVADGIARIHGLENCMALEMLELPHDVTGPRAEPRAGQRRRRAVRRVGQDRRGRHGQAHRPPAPDPGRRGAPRPAGRPARAPARRQGRAERLRDPAGRVQGARRGPAPAGEGAGPDRAQVDRRDDPDRPRPARADHRRPPDRQDRGRDRHDHQQPRQGPGLHLRGDRPAHGDRRPVPEAARGAGGDGQHDHRRRAGRRGGADQVHRAVRGMRDGRALPLQRQARALHLRRPDEARVRVSPDVAAPAPPARPRGVPGRRLLPALAPARAGGEAERRARRRVADRAADHRDAGERRVRLHPDERHLDHRRPDLPGVGPVLFGRPAGDQRRHLGLPSRRQRAD